MCTTLRNYVLYYYCSLGGVPLCADDWGVDAIYSGSQKALSGPPGAAPLFLSERAMEKIQTRKTKPVSFALDLKLVGDYWGWFGGRSYHHTGVVSTFYAMREALAIVSEEWMERMCARHQSMHELLWEGFDKMGLRPFVKQEHERLATVNTIEVPEGKSNNPNHPKGYSRTLSPSHPRTL